MSNIFYFIIKREDNKNTFLLYLYKKKSKNLFNIYAFSSYNLVMKLVSTLKSLSLSLSLEKQTWYQHCK